MIKSKSVFEFRGRHEVLDADGQQIGRSRRYFGKSLLRSHWHVRDAAGEPLFEAHEASLVVAILRRFAAIGPDWIPLLEWLPFNFMLLRDGQEVGTYRRVLGKLRDRYVLELGRGSARRRPTPRARLRRRARRTAGPLARRPVVVPGGGGVGLHSVHRAGRMLGRRVDRHAAAARRLC